MKLRPHQQKGIDMVRNSLRSGHMRPLLAAPCSYGKTVVSLTMMLAYASVGKRSVFFADRVKLVQQTAETLDRMGVDYSVMQADDPRYDPRKLIQIASIQTAVNRPNFHFDFAVVDEAHTVYKGFKEKYLDRYDNIPIVALSATPFSKGLRLVWDDLLIPITVEELTEQGYLAPIDYYVGSSVDTSNIRTKRLPTGGTEFNPDDLGAAMIEDEQLSGDIVENYLKHSPDGSVRAIAFCPTIEHSKTLVEKFNSHPSGIKARHIDGYTADDLRILQKIERENMPKPEKHSAEDKQRWLSELYFYARHAGYRQGWAHYKFKEKFGVAPSKIAAQPVDGVSLDVKNWIKSRNIANAHRRAR